ncbi:unnamed protein product [Toxocara canis]|uniref:WD_REPEATS_REGION domain-containing protein n=1 Tax=Toxocara canis TaxID=6265 RepID=A0A183U503_TOXCA|nr:unnamed protein product [Toxocara canis]
MAASSSNEVTTSSSRRNAMNGMGKLRLYVDAVEHFKKNDRIKVYDMQVPRPLTISWNCDGTRLACGAEKSVAVTTLDSSYRTVRFFKSSFATVIFGRLNFSI